MTTMLDRGSGPDKRSEMSESNSADHGDRRADSAPPCPPWREGGKRLPWVPAVASLLVFLIGLSDILTVFKPEVVDRLHKIKPFVPGFLANVTRTSDVIVGLLLILLALGLRRRKRRAWQAVLALLAFDIVIHFLHFPHLPREISISVSSIVAIVLLAALLFFHREFYAIGDPRTRWSVLNVFVVLVVADVAIGLGYLSVGPLAGNYSLSQRLQDVVYELVGVYGPVQWASDARSDLYHLLTSALGLFTLVVTIYLFLRSAQPRARLAPADRERIRDLLDQHGDPEAWPGAITEFLADAARHAWRPAVMGCSELGAEVWCREGDLSALELGDEAVVNVADFSLSG